MRLYSGLEVDILIDDISRAAFEAIELAAGEAARAAFLESVEREALLLQARALAYHDAQRWRLEAQANLLAVAQTKRAGMKKTILAGVVCFFGGIVAGTCGILIIGGR